MWYKAIIKQVENNKEKSEAYRILTGRYRKAINEGFNFEALLIDYALLEDRLRAWLFYIGVLGSRFSTKPTKSLTEYS